VRNVREEENAFDAHDESRGQPRREEAGLPARDVRHVLVVDDDGRDTREQHKDPVRVITLPAGAHTLYQQLYKPVRNYGSSICWSACFGGTGVYARRAARAWAARFWGRRGGDEACPISTGGWTRRVQSVRGRRRGGG